MAYNEFLADRISSVFKSKSVPFEEIKMMGGLCYMVDNKMCVGIIKDHLMVRLDPEIYDEALQKPGCREMDFSKHPMKGFVFVEPSAIDMDEQLEYWVQKALDFNPKAKASKKK